MTIGSSDPICKGRGETITSFPETGSGSWTCISLGTVAFLLEYTLPVIRFLADLEGDDSGLGTDSGSGIGSMGEGTGTGPVTLRGVNGKEINEIGIPILVFLEVFPLKIRNRKIKLSFIGGNIC